VPRPTPEEVKKYYAANPALFAERRVYNLEELTIEAKPEQIDALRAALQEAKDVGAFVAVLKEQGYKFSQRQALTPAERLPLDRVAAFASMKDGQASFTALPGGVQVMVMVDSRLQPVTEDQARPLIEQFLLNERRQKAIQDDLAALRTAAKIEYVGEFAEGVKPVSDLAAPAAASSGASSTSMENALKGMK
jgi:hypothetical protein